MAVAAVHGYPSNSKYMEIRDKKRNGPPPPVFISTDPSHINPSHLRDLFSASNFSCHRFPNVDPHGRVEPVDIQRLRIALSHSHVVVSVFCKPQDITTSKSSPESLKLGAVLGRVMPATPSNAQLVGFGRAVSDSGLTASIYDVVVIPSLRGMGIGRMIVRRLVRMLTSRDIYDIAALCSEDERFFFRACGFGDDVLGSTTMIYTKDVSNYPQDKQVIRRAGRRLLLAPPARKPFAT